MQELVNIRVHSIYYDLDKCNITNSCSVHVQTFCYPFGPAYDQLAVKRDDETVAEMNLLKPMPLFSTIQSKIFVSCLIDILRSDV